MPVFWAAVVCNVVAAVLAVFWLKPRVTRLVKQQAAAPQSDGSMTQEATTRTAVAE
jgi:hypothetical protein